MRHAAVEQIGHTAAARCLVHNVAEFCGGEICKENLTLTRRLASDVFGQIANGEVHGVGGLVAELGKLRFIGRDDDGNNGAVL